MKNLMLLLLILTMTVATAACAPSATDEPGVATLDDTSAPDDDASEAPTEDAEQAMLDYTQCLREQGLNVPDPEFDEDGRIVVGRSTGGGGDTQGDGEGGDAKPENFSPEAFAKAQEVCGDPPEEAMPEFSPEDQSAMQDAALKFAKCMREHGIDMPDPEIDDDGGVMMQRAGEGGDINDPNFQAAQEECQEAFAELPAPGDGEDGS